MSTLIIQGRKLTVAESADEVIDQISDSDGPFVALTLMLDNEPVRVRVQAIDAIREGAR